MVNDAKFNSNSILRFLHPAIEPDNDSIPMGNSHCLLQFTKINIDSRQRSTVAQLDEEDFFTALTTDSYILIVSQAVVTFTKYFILHNMYFIMQK